jgi:hypothetical protein
MPNDITTTRTHLTQVKQVEWPPDRPNPNNPVQAFLRSFQEFKPSFEEVDGIEDEPETLEVPESAHLASGRNCLHLRAPFRERADHANRIGEEKAANLRKVPGTLRRWEPTRRKRTRRTPRHRP